jgi:hypothetical protein
VDLFRQGCHDLQQLDYYLFPLCSTPAGRRFALC